MTIHPTAVVASSAQLGQDVTIGPFTFIDDRVVIGSGCVINSHVAILRNTTLGENCQVHSGAVLGDVPQDLKFTNEETYVKIGSRCTIREGVTIHRGTKLGTATEVGNDCLLMANSHLGHNVKVGNNVIIANGALLAGYVEVGDKTFISGNCLLHQFTRVGRLVMMSGGSAVGRDIPPFCMTPGLAGNTIMGLNIVGLRRAGFTSEQRLTLKRVLKILYQSNLNISDAVAKLEADFPDEELVQEFCDFVKTSERGICKFIK
ncbi:acyl-ACP--UDP-N-acetylglucosamine O-acyltransferase [Oscillatoria salina]|uniref:acyl-ACP--UDP-N-acetylglucosamine O-acyltransferase n=1 Tax=Oscillatoria salina TaxID=331517 RepID=UPI001CCE94EB|nr:acyl-ACP--UDP-N-acetylglucosamine O-acyltransferase [Oscillatoria salina]MBZ8179930.1 acyl-ACP--UDP-N-acetylglucosamine O-acyltransferase [Oscillatoria salina IIICB1]